MMTLSKRLDDLEKGIKNKRIGAEKVKTITIIGDGWIETWDLEEHTQTRIYDHDEQDKQAS